MISAIHFFCGSTSENQFGIYPYDVCIGKLNVSGELDLTFGDNGIFRTDFPYHTISSLKGAQLDDNGIYFIGNAVNQDVPDTNAFYIGKINLEGELDSSFRKTMVFYTSSNFWEPTIHQVIF